MKNRLRRAAALLLCFVLGCAPLPESASLQLYAYLGRNIPEGTAHTELSFSELRCHSVDPALLSDRILRLAERIDDPAEDAHALQAELESLYGAAAQLENDAALVYVRHCLDCTDEALTAQANRLNRSLDGIFAALNEAALRLSARPALRASYPAETVAALEAAVRLYDPAVQPLLERETALMDAYDAMTVSFSIEADGEVWDEARLAADTTLPFEAWYALRKAFDAAFATAAGELFCELVQVRRAIADALGFDSYPAYRYAAYGRDYLPAEAASFCETAARQLAPLFREALIATAADRQTLYLTEQGDTEEQLLAIVRTVIERIDPSLCEPWDYMIGHGMLDCSVSGTKLPGSYTTYFSAYGAPFLYLTREDAFEAPTVLLHEFGHYAGYYFRGDATLPLDLAEAESQGLELLAIPFYPLLYGNRADEARAVKLCDLLYAILSGCLIDAFEQAVYADPDPTPESLSEMFERLTVRIGLDDAGYTADTWTRIPHLFRAPSYYISYAAGAVAALSLRETAMQSPAWAIGRYRALLHSSGTDRRALLRRCGLPDFLSVDVAALGSFLRRELSLENADDSHIAFPAAA
ncbi:MAG: hypothetical protein IJP98_00835 [Clostridia bacterium]|nr:hypothetical protein [Clostridia bacterium]